MYIIAMLIKIRKFLLAYECDGHTCPDGCTECILDHASASAHASYAAACDLEDDNDDAFQWWCWLRGYAARLLPPAPSECIKWSFSLILKPGGVCREGTHTGLGAEDRMQCVWTEVESMLNYKLNVVKQDVLWSNIGWHWYGWFVTEIPATRTHY